MTPQLLRIPASDDRPLHARLFTPAAQARGTVLISTAMAVPQSYYAGFAGYLAGHGFRVYTYDYRGMGEDAPASLRGFDCSVTDWAQKDYNAALRHAKAAAPDLPLYVVGHSLGGQLPGLLPDHRLIAGLVTVASGSGYWRENAPQLKRSVPFMWYGLVPALTPLFGYWPGAKLNMVGNLPKGVIYEWRRWCLHPDYVCDAAGRRIEAHFPEIRFPILSLSFTDDEYMSETNIRRLHGRYANAQVEFRRIAPADHGVKRIGHFGFFRKQFDATLWPQALDWLNQRNAADPGASIIPTAAAATTPA
jgi:predicted alpha/beta hydrolase